MPRLLECRGQQQHAVGKTAATVAAAALAPAPATLSAAALAAATAACHEH